jgi:predicted DNA-binding antitoxin AbrB/MazE fold protein
VTTSITAVFEAGLLRPTSPLVLPEGTRVELIIISDEKDGKRAGRSAALQGFFIRDIRPAGVHPFLGPLA